MRVRPGLSLGPLEAKGARPLRLLAVIGTRPEAIKMAPLLVALRDESAIRLRLCLSGQHRELIDPVLRLFGIEADLDLALMSSGQGLNGLAGKALQRLDEAYVAEAPDRLLVHGDTTTALAASLAAFHRGVPVAHVEAGLRSGDLARPFPEEMNRRAIDLVADLLFAPTQSARRNLEEERVQGRVFVTGNTGVDALDAILRRLDADDGLRLQTDAVLPQAAPGKRLLLVTGHRRESFGEGFHGLCAALRELGERGDLDIVFPVHLNPAVREPVEAALSGCDVIRLLPPLDFVEMVRLMQRVDLVLTDSGGIQEEAPSLRKPVLVTRDVTERPEGVARGMARLVGTEAARIVAAVSEAIADEEREKVFVGGNPYGDGRASRRIADALLGRPVEEFAG